jgi:7,8-dihydroneopterin aldolase/epimerase/oxygenase
MSDKILIEGIEVVARVGVTEEERAKFQKLEVSISLELDLAPAAEEQDIKFTVDYAQVHQKTLEIVGSRARPLIETVAEDIAQMVLDAFKVAKVTVEVRKFILPETRYVAVQITRQR